MAFAKGVIKEFLEKVLIGMGLGMAADAGIEVLRIPVLNDSGTFGDPMMSNAEYAAYAISVFGTIAGIADIGVGTGVLTFTKTGFPILMGFGLGFYFWEHTFATLTGIRKYNPYELVGHAIPQVIPGNIPVPGIQGPGPHFVRPGMDLPGTQYGGPLHPGLR